MSQRAKYTPAEDSDLLAFVEANKHHHPLGGKKLWILAEAQRITTHSWQSMKSRYELLLRSKSKGKRTMPKTATTHATLMQPRLPFTPTPTSTPTTSTRRTSTTKTLTATVTWMGQRRTFTDAETLTDQTNMHDVGVAIHLYCPVAHYWTAEGGTQTTTPLPKQKRSHSM